MGAVKSRDTSPEMYVRRAFQPQQQLCRGSHSLVVAGRWPDRVPVRPRRQPGDIRDERRRLRPDQPRQECRRRLVSSLVAGITPQGHAGVAVSAFAAIRFRLTARKGIPLSQVDLHTAGSGQSSRGRRRPPTTRSSGRTHRKRDRPGPPPPSGTGATPGRPAGPPNGGRHSPSTPRRGAVARRRDGKQKPSHARWGACGLLAQNATGRPAPGGPCRLEDKPGNRR